MFTDKYIKMCEQATEIQQGWKPKVGDWYKMGNASVEIALPEDFRDSFFDSPSPLYKAVFTFFPLQHQLQEMVKEKYKNLAGDIKTVTLVLFPRFWEQEVECEYRNIFESVEELWLAFAMDELYQKKWNNSKGVWE